MKTKIVLILSLISISGFGQDSLKVAKKSSANFFSIWAFHQKKVKVDGVSVGLISLSDKPISTNTNGLKLEIIGAGIILPLIPNSPIVENDSLLKQYQKTMVLDRINGLNLSPSGTACECLVNGISSGFIGQALYKVNGFSATLYLNFVQIHNGIQIALFNETYQTNGLQSGLFNGSSLTKGVQMGLTNTSTDFRGFQIGLLNKTKTQKGLQIGFWNNNDKRSMPFINW